MLKKDGNGYTRYIPLGDPPPKGSEPSSGSTHCFLVCSKREQSPLFEQTLIERFSEKVLIKRIAPFVYERMVYFITII